MNVSLHSISHSEPHLEPFAMQGDAATDKLRDMLVRDGVASFARSDAGVARMACEAIAGTLSKSGLAPSAIDAVVVATESFWDFGTGESTFVDFRNDFLRRILLELGLTRAHIIGAWSGGCGNFLPGLSAARALIASGQARHVLLVASDRVRPGAERVLRSGSAVLGDVAAACIISSGEGDFCIDQVVLQPNASILTSRAEQNFILHARHLVDSLGKMNVLLSERTGARIADVDYLVVEGFNESVINLVGSRLSVARSKIFCAARNRYGHAFSADLLLSLELLAKEVTLPAHAIIGMVSVSSWVLGSAILRRSATHGS